VAVLCLLFKKCFVECHCRYYSINSQDKVVAEPKKNAMQYTITLVSPKEANVAKLSNPSHLRPI
jgi:hypothetical protein